MYAEQSRGTLPSSMIPLGWTAKPEAYTAVSYAVPHIVTPRVLHRFISTVLPSGAIKVKNFRDVQGCVSTLKMSDAGKPGAGTCLMGINNEASQEVLEYFDALAEFAATLPHLLTLDMSEMRIDRRFFDALGSAAFNKLQQLVLQDCPNVDLECYKHIATIPNLLSLSVSETQRFIQMTPEDIEEDARVREELMASYPDIMHVKHPVLHKPSDPTRCSELIQVMSTITTLREICLTNCVLSEVEMELISQTEIQSVSFVNGYFPSAGLRFLPKMTSLVVLGFGNCCIDNDGLASVAQVPNLLALDLSMCRKIDGEGMAKIAGIKTLKRLGVYSCPELDAEALKGCAHIPGDRLYSAK